MSFFPKLGEYVDRETFSTKIEPTIMGMMVDPVFMIREQSTNTLIRLSTALFDQAWLERVIESKLEELVKHERFMLRIQTIHLINQMKGHVSDATVDRLFAKHLLTLCADPVPNIRFNVSKALGGIYPLITASNQRLVKTALEKMAETDTDFDAKFYAEKTLETVVNASQ